MDLTNLYSGYLRASTYERVPRKVLRRGLKPFHLTFGDARGKSDTQLQKLAARRVLRQFRKSEDKTFKPITPTKKRKAQPGRMQLF